MGLTLHAGSSLKKRGLPRWDLGENREKSLLPVNVLLRQGLGIGSRLGKHLGKLGTWPGTRKDLPEHTGVITHLCTAWGGDWIGTQRRRGLGKDGGGRHYRLWEHKGALGYQLCIVLCFQPTCTTCGRVPLTSHPGEWIGRGRGRLRDLAEKPGGSGVLEKWKWSVTAPARTTEQWANRVDLNRKDLTWDVVLIATGAILIAHVCAFLFATFLSADFILANKVWNIFSLSLSFCSSCNSPHLYQLGRELFTIASCSDYRSHIKSYEFEWPESNPSLSGIRRSYSRLCSIQFLDINTSNDPHFSYGILFLYIRNTNSGSSTFVSLPYQLSQEPNPPCWIPCPPIWHKREDPVRATLPRHGGISTDYQGQSLPHGIVLEIPNWHLQSWSLPQRKRSNTCLTNACLHLHEIYIRPAESTSHEQKDYVRVWQTFWNLSNILKWSPYIYKYHRRQNEFWNNLFIQYKMKVHYEEACNTFFFL